MLKITILVGNPKANSRTLQVSTRLVAELLGPVEADVQTIDLADYQGSLFAWPSDEMSSLTDRVAASNLLVIASPTYKASYTGLLKAFLDRYPANGLRGVLAVPVMTGADSTHSMGADTHLAPLLIELGAIVLGRSFYFITGQMDRFAEIASAEAADLRERLRALRVVADELAATD